MANIHEQIMGSVDSKYQSEIDRLEEIFKINEMLLEKGTHPEKHVKLSIAKKMEQVRKLIDAYYTRLEKMSLTGYLDFDDKTVVKSNFAKAMMQFRNDKMANLNARIAVIENEKIGLYATEAESRYVSILREAKKIKLNERIKKLEKKQGRIATTQRIAANRHIGKGLRSFIGQRKHIENHQSKVDELMKSRYSLLSEREQNEIDLRAIIEAINNAKEKKASSSLLSEFSIQQRVFEERIEKLKNKEGKLDNKIERRLDFKGLKDDKVEKIVSEKMPSRWGYFVSAMKATFNSRRGRIVVEPVIEPEPIVTPPIESEPVIEPEPIVPVVESEPIVSEVEPTLAPEDFLNVDNFETVHLRSAAAMMQIKGYSKLLKADLIEKIKENKNYKGVLMGYNNIKDFVRENSESLERKMS